MLRVGSLGVWYQGLLILITQPCSTFDPFILDYQLTNIKHNFIDAINILHDRPTSSHGIVADGKWLRPRQFA
jgi:hypothetical protein